MQHIKSEIMMRLKEVDKAQADVLFSQQAVKKELATVDELAQS